MWTMMMDPSVSLSLSTLKGVSLWNNRAATLRSFLRQFFCCRPSCCCCGACCRRPLIYRLHYVRPEPVFDRQPRHRLSPLSLHLGWWFRGYPVAAEWAAAVDSKRQHRRIHQRRVDAVESLSCGKDFDEEKKRRGRLAADWQSPRPPARNQTLTGLRATFHTRNNCAIRSSFAFVICLFVLLSCRPGNRTIVLRSRSWTWPDGKHSMAIEVQRLSQFGVGSSFPFSTPFAGFLSSFF